jgi:hypothetical protein
MLLQTPRRCHPNWPLKLLIALKAVRFSQQVDTLAATANLQPDDARPYKQRHGALNMVRLRRVCALIHSIYDEVLFTIEFWMSWAYEKDNERT